MGDLLLNLSIENDANFKGYASGNEEPGRGFGHVCISVDNLEAACKRFDELGVKFKKRPEEGRMRVSETSSFSTGGEKGGGGGYLMRRVMRRECEAGSDAAKAAVIPHQSNGKMWMEG